MAAGSKLLVVGAISLVAGITTFAVVRAGMRKRCRRQVRTAVRKLPLVTDAWVAEQERKICVGQGPRGPRGMRRRQDASHPSMRDAIAGSIDAKEQRR